MPKQGKVKLFAVPKNAIQALEGLLKSYKGRIAEQPATEADQAVLTVVQRTLNNLKNGQKLAVSRGSLFD